MTHVIVTRNASYQPLKTSTTDVSLLRKLLALAPEVADTEIHIRSLNGLKIDCQHSSKTILYLSASASITKNGDPILCKGCTKWRVPGRIDLRFKPWPDVRKYLDCNHFTLNQLNSNGMELLGLTYRLGKPRKQGCKVCGANIHPHLPRGTEWEVFVDLFNPQNGLILRAIRHVKCFVDTSGHTAAGIDAQFSLILPKSATTPSAFNHITSSAFTKRACEESEPSKTKMIKLSPLPMIPIIVAPACATILPTDSADSVISSDSAMELITNPFLDFPPDEFLDFKPENYETFFSPEPVRSAFQCGATEQPLLTELDQPFHEPLFGHLVSMGMDKDSGFF